MVFSHFHNLPSCDSAALEQQGEFRAASSDSPALRNRNRRRPSALVHALVHASAVMAQVGPDNSLVYAAYDVSVYWPFLNEMEGN